MTVPKRLATASAVAATGILVTVAAIATALTPQRAESQPVWLIFVYEGFFLSLFGWPLAFGLAYGLSLILLSRTPQPSWGLVRTVLIGAVVGATVLPVAWGLVFGWYEVWPMIPIGSAAGAVGATLFWGTLHFFARREKAPAGT